MLRLALEYPQQCERGLEIGEAFPLPRLGGSPECVVVAGMGGSAAGGELLRVLAGPRLAAPVFVHRDYSLPPFVGAKSLVLVASYSGDTEEAVDSYKEARRRGATRIAFCSGGRLARLARKDGISLCVLPGGQPRRTASGYFFFPMYVALERLGVLKGDRRGKAETLVLLRALAKEWAPEVPLSRNRAKRLAQACYGRVPVIYGWDGLTYAVAMRWKAQFNENAKVPSFCYALPELNHNEIMGWGRSEGLASRFAAIWLRDKREPKRIAQRFELTRSALRERLRGVEEWSEGTSAMARMFSLWYLGDWASIYLALAYRTDPTPIPAIVALKQALAGRK